MTATKRRPRGGGSYRQRGRNSWEIRYDLPPGPDGGRRIAYQTVKGSRADAMKALREALHKQDKGVAVNPSSATVADFLGEWLSDVAPRSVAPKALERYHGLVKFQIIPHIGAIKLQKLRPADIDAWLAALESSKLSVRSIRHAHGVLRSALSHAAAVEMIERNVAKIIKPPKLERKEIEILTEDEIAETLRKLDGHPFYPVAAFAIGTGARRGEIAALRWDDVDWDRASVRIERSTEQTRNSMRTKATKTAAGKRTVSLPASILTVLREHRRQQLELRLALGIGAPPANAPVFTDLEGNPIAPDLITSRWRRAIRHRKLPKVSFHALRHSHASALIAAGLDVIAVSRRLGHASPALTLSVYGHLFKNKDQEAADAIDTVLGR